MKQLVFESELREPIIRVVMESTVVTPWKAEKERPPLVDILKEAWPFLLHMLSLCC